MSCCYCSTTEGKPELTSTENLLNQPLCTLTGTSHSSKSMSLHWCHDEKPCSGTVPYGILWTEHISAHQQRREVSSKFHANTQKEEQKTTQNAHYHPCQVSNSTILFMENPLLMSGHHSKHSKRMHSPFKTVFRKIRDKYQSYCTMYKTHTNGHPPWRCRTPTESLIFT